MHFFFIRRSSRIYGGGEGSKVMAAAAAAAARQQLELQYIGKEMDLIAKSLLQCRAVVCASTCVQPGLLILCGCICRYIITKTTTKRGLCKLRTVHGLKGFFLRRSLSLSRSLAFLRARS